MPNMKAWPALLLIFALLVAGAPLLAQQNQSNAAVPKYDPAAETIVKGTVDEVRDRQCALSHGVGSHVMLKLADGKLIEAHIAPAKFVKAYDLAFNKGDQLEITGTKVNFEGVETIFAREIKRGSDTFAFRDKEGRPIW
jgi:hypothetical protein